MSGGECCGAVRGVTTMGVSRLEADNWSRWVASVVGNEGLGTVEVTPQPHGADATLRVQNLAKRVKRAKSQTHIHVCSITAHKREMVLTTKHSYRFISGIEYIDVDFQEGPHRQRLMAHSLLLPLLLTVNQERTK